MIKKRVYNVFSIIISICCLASFINIIPVKADKLSCDIDSLIYEFDEDSKYEIDSSNPTVIFEHESFGKVTLEGKINKSYNKDKIQAFEIEDNELISLDFKYSDLLSKAKESEWHLYEDSVKTVNNLSFDNKIQNGAVILQTSYDNKKWYTNYKKGNVSGNISFNDCINDIQLYNGCYYRVIVAYEVQKKVDPFTVPFLFWDTPIKIPENEYQKNAEVFCFYASYKNVNNTIQENKNYYKSGNLQPVEVDSGFSKPIKMSSDDPHLGWELGNFIVSGFTSKQENPNDDIVFLKNPGDKIALWFVMGQNVNIYKLKNNSDLSINYDYNAYDSKFSNIPKQNFGRGALILNYINSNGEDTPIVYTNFLEALVSPGANTKIHLFEEGDYEVILDYEILNEKGFDKLYNYRMPFKFKIRNSNTIFYSKDVVTGSYLANDAITENGFVLDMANSKYLNVNVTLSQWTKGVNGYTEDIVFNREAKDSEKFLRPGIYTITVTNPTTDPYGNNPTVKRVYVGSDSVMVAYMNKQNSSRSVNEIYNLVENEGFNISDKGVLIPPVTTQIVETTIPATVTTTATMTTTTTTTVISSDTELTTVPVSEPEVQNIESIKTNSKNVIKNWDLRTILISVSVIIIFVLLYLLLRSENNKKKNKDNSGD